MRVSAWIEKYAQSERYQLGCQVISPLSIPSLRLLLRVYVKIIGLVRFVGIMFSQVNCIEKGESAIVAAAM